MKHSFLLLIFLSLFITACGTSKVTIDSAEAALKNSKIPVTGLTVERTGDIGNIRFSDSRTTPPFSDAAAKVLRNAGMDTANLDSSIAVFNTVEEAEGSAKLLENLHGAGVHIFRHKNIVVSLNKQLSDAQVDEYRRLILSL